MRSKYIQRHFGNNQYPQSEEPISRVPVQVIHTDDEDVLNEIKIAYQRFKKESWYIEPIVRKDDSLALAFSDENSATAFAKEQAKAGHKFIVSDKKTGQVKGYSDGTAFYKNTDNKSLEEIRSELST